MEAFIIFGFSIAPFLLGISIFIYLPKLQSKFPWYIFTLLRGLVFSFLIIPTLFVAGDGGFLTNTVGGLVAAGIYGDFNAGLTSHATRYGVYLLPCILGLVIYSIVFIIDAVIHKSK